MSALLNAPVYAPGTPVILKNMDQSEYRDVKYNNTSGQVRSSCDNTQRTLVEITGLGVAYLRSINPIEDEGLRQHLPDSKPKPHPKLVALLEVKQRAQDLLDRSMVIKEIQDRIRMLEMELADPEPLSALALYDMMTEAYEVYCPKDVESATTCTDRLEWTTCTDRLEWTKSMSKEVNDLDAAKNYS